jgi:hypothetical protein
LDREVDDAEAAEVEVHMFFRDFAMSQIGGAAAFLADREDQQARAASMVERTRRSIGAP